MTRSPESGILGPGLALTYGGAGGLEEEWCDGQDGWRKAGGEGIWLGDLARGRETAEETRTKATQSVTVGVAFSSVRWWLTCSGSAQGRVRAQLSVAERVGLVACGVTFCSVGGRFYEFLSGPLFPRQHGNGCCV